MTVLDSPVTAPDPVRVSGHRRRGLLLAGAMLVVAIGAVAIDAKVLSYQPIVDAGMYGPRAGEPQQIEAPDYRGALQWDFAPGERFAFAFAIRNDGDRSVRVVDIPDAGGPPAYWTRERVEVSEVFEGSHCCVAEDLREFAPFTLHPGDVRELVFTYRFRSCELTDASQWATHSWRRQAITYRFWNVTRDVDLEMPFVAAVRAGGDCREARN